MPRPADVNRCRYEVERVMADAVDAFPSSAPAGPIVLTCFSYRGHVHFDLRPTQLNFLGRGGMGGTIDVY